MPVGFSLIYALSFLGQWFKTDIATERAEESYKLKNSK